MRLLLNENVAGTVIRTLRRRGHDVLQYTHAYSLGRVRYAF